MGMKEFEIHNVFVNENEFLLLLKETEGEGSYVPMVIGALEANYILMVLDGIMPDRPFLCDVFFEVMGNTDMIVESLEIYDLREDIFYSRLFVELSSGNSHAYDIRPSDGVAIALRFNAPIFIDEEVLAKIREDQMMQDTIEQFSQEETDDEPDAPEGEKSDGAEYDTGYLNLDLHDQELHQLNYQLNLAVRDEKYEEAAMIRDRIRRIKKSP
jgi:uncharacterized protein